MTNIFDEEEIDVVSEYGLGVVLERANQKAAKATQNYIDTELNGQDNMPCGFAWVDFLSYNGVKITGNTKIGRLMKKSGLKQNHYKRFSVWCPGRVMCQNVDALKAGADAFAEVLKENGFHVVASSRLD